MKDYILCKICGYKCKRITKFHLDKHNITVKEYKEKYGYLDCELTRYNRGQSNKGKLSKFNQRLRSLLPLGGR